MERLRESAADRDNAMWKVSMVRAGRFGDVWPDQFGEVFPDSMVANFVDVSARDLAANLSGLPSLACASGNMRTSADKERAERKNRIGFNFWLKSKLEFQMKYGADQYITYGFLPIWVEADYKAKMPVINVEDPEGCYFEVDRKFRTVHYAKVWNEDLNALAIQYPEFSNQILTDPKTGEPDTEEDTEVVRWIDDQVVMLYLPKRGNMIIGMYKHGMSRCPVHIALRPGLHLDPRGVFDDVIYVQLAHAVMAQLTLEAGHKAVQAPTILPSDVNEVNIGPDAVIVTDNPNGVRRMGLDVPQAAFALDQTLTAEMREGAGYPDSRLGNGPAGGSTGRGIAALEGGFNQQIAMSQDVFKLALIETTSMCFEMDVTLWPDKPKTISGILSGESFQITYVPSKDIGDNYTCDVTYGFASGTSPQGAIVTLLQLRGDNLVGRDYVRRQLPMQFDIEQQQREVDVEVIEDGMKQGLAASLQSVGQMMAQGQTAEAMQMLQAAAGIIEGREKGEPLAQLFVKYFQPPPPPPAPPTPPGGPSSPGAPGSPGGPDDQGINGVGPNGLPQGVAPGQAGLPPGGRPRVSDLAAGFTSSGAPSVSDSVRGRLATG